jgi:predicted RNA-binding protein YlxR (DUF448 family)
MKPNIEKTRHIPERTCIACRQIKPKREMVRIVKVSDTIIQIDEIGKQSGRGAYLCKTKQCWNEGLKGNRLEHVLRTPLSQADKQRLEEYTKQL